MYYIHTMQCNVMVLTNESDENEMERKENKKDLLGMITTAFSMSILLLNILNRNTHTYVTYYKMHKA